jgi:hypothetical protein
VKKRRPLRFALSGALLVPGLLGTACGPSEEDATMNVTAPDPPPLETANPVGDEPPTTDPVDEERPQPTVNPAQDPEDEADPPPSMRTNVR